MRLQSYILILIANHSSNPKSLFRYVCSQVFNSWSNYCMFIGKYMQAVCIVIATSWSKQTNSNSIMVYAA